MPSYRPELKLKLSFSGHTMKSGDMEITQLGIYPSRFYTISIMRVKKMKEEEDKVTGKKEEKEEKDEEEAAEDRVEDENAGRIIYHMWYEVFANFCLLNI